MRPATLAFVTLVLAALGRAPGAAHVMEMPVKLGYAPQLYAAVTSTLHALFGSFGAVVQMGALVAAAALAWVSRHATSFRWALAGASLLALSLIVWGAAVAHVNAEWARATETGQVALLPQLYARLRLEWRHAGAFLAWLAGYGALQCFVLSERSQCFAA